MSRFLVLLVLALLAVSCSSPEPPASEPALAEPVATEAAPEAAAPADTAPAESTPALDEATLAGLAAADALDGAADHVVAKCAGCALRMDGKAEHSLAVGDYTLHLCSSPCQDHFAADLAGGLAGLVAAASPAGEPEDSGH
jgi:hypothetical protein